MTETYIALRINIDNWRWGPMCLFTCGSANGCRIGHRDFRPFQAKKLPHSVQQETVKIDQNVLVIRIQPDEGNFIANAGKNSGKPVCRIEPVKMDFHLWHFLWEASPEALRRLLSTAMSATPRSLRGPDEVEEAWTFIDPIEEAWHAKKDAPELYFYPDRDRGDLKLPIDLLARMARLREDYKTPLCLRAADILVSALPVEIGKNEQELKKLCRGEGANNAAASLMILPLTANNGSTERQHAGLMAKITRTTPARGLSSKPMPVRRIG